MGNHTRLAARSAASGTVVALEALNSEVPACSLIKEKGRACCPLASCIEGAALRVLVTGELGVPAPIPWLNGRPPLWH